MGRVCAEPGCPKLVENAEARGRREGRYCEPHRRERERKDAEHRREYYDERGSRHERGYDSKWTKAAKAFLDAHPDCARCGGRHDRMHVDHKKPFRVDGEPNWKLFWDRSNWQTLCHPCHVTKTHEEKRDRAEGERHPGNT
jgi:5-methylcytosine-specific restriction protein A